MRIDGVWIDGVWIDGVRRVAFAVAALGILLTGPSACGSAQHRDTDATGHRGSGAEPGGPAGSPDAGSPRPGSPSPGPQDPTRIPDVGDRLQRRIPVDSGQVVAVYGDGRDSADSTVVLYAKYGANWRRVRAWPAHNGKKGWTTYHRSGDRRSPVGVFTLTDAGGVLDDPGARLPYTRDSAFAAPRWWPATHWHDFDYVIAIDYNRVAGTPPNDPTRPRGEEKGGSIWLHMDHGSGTSGCVSMSKSDMEYLLRTLDPDRHPVVVMGDRAELTA